MDMIIIKKKKMRTYTLIPPSEIPKGINPSKPIWKWKRKFDGKIKSSALLSRP
jgi:hypothetical protein